MPNTYIHTIYREYLVTQLDEAKKRAHEESQAAEEVVDSMT